MFGATARRSDDDGHHRRYAAPNNYQMIELGALLEYCGRGLVGPRAPELFAKAEPDKTAHMPIYYAGELNLLCRPCVAIVGTRKVSADGAARARRLAKELVQAGVVVVSGLAEGVDTCAHTSAINSGGRTVAVIGTPLDKAYPAVNGPLQETIYSQHLLLSQFRHGTKTFQSSFPQRNKVMAAITDATVIIEASDTSGTLHQAAECARLGRWLFIARSVTEDPSLTWPKRFLHSEKVGILDSTESLIRTISQVPHA
jgi:DNA processing protein